MLDLDGIRQSERQFKFRGNFTMICSGPTQSGKSTFIRSLIEKRHLLLDPPPVKIFWFYGSIAQPWFVDYSYITFIKNLDEEKLSELLLIRDVGSRQGKLIILDDLMDELSNSKLVEQLFYKHAHHFGFSIIILVQNLFAKNLRTISLNSHFIVLFKNRRDEDICRKLALQADPTNVKAVQLAFKDATKLPYSYFIFNLSPDSDDSLKYITNIFGEQFPYPLVYSPDSK